MQRLRTIFAEHSMHDDDHVDPDADRGWSRIRACRIDERHGECATRTWDAIAAPAQSGWTRVRGRAGGGGRWMDSRRREVM